MLADNMPLGPRRDNVAKAEQEVTIAQAVLDMAIDNGDWLGATMALAQLRAARDKVQEIMGTWILDLPGAPEFFERLRTRDAS